MARKTQLTEATLHRELSRSVKTLVDFTKETTVMNVVQSVRNGDLDLGESDLTKLTELINLSVEQSFTNGYKEIEESIKKVSLML